MHKTIKIFLFLIFLASINYSAGIASININDCGYYHITVSDTPGTMTFNFTSNITATTESNITNGACVVIDPGISSCVGPGFNPATVEILFNGMSITNINSLAESAILIMNSQHGDCSLGDRIHIYGFNPSGIITLNGFSNAIKYNGDFLYGTGDGGRYYNISFLSPINIIAYNTTNIFNGIITNTNLYNWVMPSNIYTCNIMNVFTVPVKTTGFNLLKIDGDCAYAKLTNSSSNFDNSQSRINNMYNNNTGSLFLISSLGINLYASLNKTSLFVINGNVNASYEIQQILGNTTTSTIFYLISYPSNLNISTTSYNILSDDKIYYCLSGYCNPLKFDNYSDFPFFLFIPTSFSPVILNFEFEKIRISQWQGVVKYYIAGTDDSNDTIFYLLNGGLYEINITNSTGQSTLYNATILCALNQYTNCILNFIDGVPYTYSTTSYLPYIQVCTEQNNAYYIQTNLTTDVFHLTIVNLTNGSVFNYVGNNTNNYAITINLTGVSNIIYTINNNTQCEWNPQGNFFGLGKIEYPDNNISKTLIAVPIFMTTIALSIAMPYTFAFVLAANDVLGITSNQNIAILGVLLGILSPITGWYGQRSFKMLFIFFIIGASYILISYQVANEQFTFALTLWEQILKMYGYIQNGITAENLASIIINVPLFLINLIGTFLFLPDLLYQLLFYFVNSLNTSFGSVIAFFEVPIRASGYGFIALKAYEVISNRYQPV